MDTVQMLTTESDSCERSHHSQWFKIWSFVWLLTKAEVRDGLCLGTSVSLTSESTLRERMGSRDQLTCLLRESHPARETFWVRVQALTFEFLSFWCRKSVSVTHCGYLLISVGIRINWKRMQQVTLWMHNPFTVYTLNYCLWICFSFCFTWMILAPNNLKFASSPGIKL